MELDALEKIRGAVQSLRPSTEAPPDLSVIGLSAPGNSGPGVQGLVEGSPEELAALLAMIELQGKEEEDGDRTVPPRSKVGASQTWCSAFISCCVSEFRSIRALV